MKLNHMNICTSEVNAAAELFVKYFGFNRTSMAGDTLAVLHDETGFSLLFSNFSKATKPLVYPEGFHFGFILGNREQVDQAYTRLHADGLASNPPRVMHGSWTFYFKAPGEFIVEVQCPA